MKTIKTRLIPVVIALAMLFGIAPAGTVSASAYTEYAISNFGEPLIYNSIPPEADYIKVMVITDFSSLIPYLSAIKSYR